MVDLPAATEFMAGHARVLDRRRFELRSGDVDPASVLAALDGYRNADGGYGWGLEPDLRTPESQPGSALHAFEVFEETGQAASPSAIALCDWLGSIALPGGALPMALPVAVATGTAPWWQAADPSVPSLQITAVTAAAAHRAGVDPSHPWLAAATDWCLREIDAFEEAPFAYVLAFAVHFLDAVHDLRPEAAGLLSGLREFFPDDGLLPVKGGTEDERLRPLDVAPFPDRPARALFAPEVVEADLDRLVSMQRDDGGWTVDYRVISPAGALDWRGIATVRAIDVLTRNGRLPG